jgi:hypothetical protein
MKLNNQLKGGSGYSCNNGNHGSGDDGGCCDCNGDTVRGSGGDGNTVGCSDGNGCNNGSSVGDMRAMA